MRVVPGQAIRGGPISQRGLPPVARDGAGPVRGVDGHRHDGVGRGSIGDGGRRRRRGAGRRFGRHPFGQRWPDVPRIAGSSGQMGTALGWRRALGLTVASGIGPTGTARGRMG